MLFSAFSFLTFLFVKKKEFYLLYVLYLNRTANRNCKDRCVSHVSLRRMFFNRAVFLMESTLNIIIITKRDYLLLILNDFFNECL